MAQSFTINLPADVKQEIDELSQLDGVSPDEIVGRAVKQHIFRRKFHSLREKMAATAQDQGTSTDQDVFDRVS
ncbi:MAG: hypothetical protein GC154_17770 [bacterium]|nr:hypothetical protein [bacterium]